MALVVRAMRYRSEKKTKEYVERRKVVAEMLDKYPYCQACPIFAAYDKKITYQRRPSVDVHELKRRSQGGSILERDNLLCVCRQCHDRIGKYPQLAFDLGLAIHGWDN